jgi:integrase/recombinase XerD
MASQPRFDKKRKRWAVDYFQGGRRRRKFFRYRENAMDFWRDQVFKKERIGAGLGYVEDVNFETAAKLFRGQHVLLKSKSHQERERQRFDFLCQTLGHLRLSEIDAARLSVFMLDRLQAGASNKTVLNDLTALSSMFRWAVKSGYAASNPVDGLAKPAPLPRRVRRALTEEEVQSLLARSCRCCFPALAVLANTGIRTGELLALEKKDFDLKRHVLRLQHSEASPIKGKQGRTVPLNDFVARVVAGLPEGKVFPWAASKLKEHFKATRRRAGVEACLHELRHTYLTALVSSNVDLKTAQKISGHKRTSTLEKYLHWTGPDLEGLRNRVSFAVTDQSQRKAIKGKDWDLITTKGEDEKPGKIKGFWKDQPVQALTKTLEKTLPRGFESRPCSRKSLKNKSKKIRSHK